MKTSIPVNCGNSPRSLLAAQIAISLASNKYSKLEPLLAEGFTKTFAGSSKVLSKLELRDEMNEVRDSKVQVESFDVISSFSHGKYAAVSSRARMVNGEIHHSHDLYEFSGAGSSAKLKNITSYTLVTKN